jgi:hypothetical protein
VSARSCADRPIVAGGPRGLTYCMDMPARRAICFCCVPRCGGAQILERKESAFRPNSFLPPALCAMPDSSRHQELDELTKEARRSSALRCDCSWESTRESRRFVRQTREIIAESRALMSRVRASSDLHDLTRPAQPNRMVALPLVQRSLPRRPRRSEDHHQCHCPRCRRRQFEARPTVEIMPSLMAH